MTDLVNARRPAEAVHERAIVISELAIVVVLAAWALLIRLPFFFPAQLDWDESSLILMGQGIFDGALPYDRLWQLKPPLAFVPFAGAIALFGKSVIGVRLIGYLCVVVTSYFVYRACQLITRNVLPALLAALVSTSAISIFQPESMTEVICIVPLSAALLLLFNDTIGPARAFSIGLLLGTAVIIRTNLAVLAIAAGAVVTFRPPVLPFSRLLLRGGAFAAGGLLVIGATVLPYLVTGRLQLWFNSVVLAGMEFSSSRRSIANLRELVIAGLGLHPERGAGLGLRPDERGDYPIVLLKLLLWIGGLAGMCFAAATWHRRPKEVRRRILITAVFLFSAVVSIGISGAPHPHYLVQLAPWFAIFLGVALSAAAAKVPRLLPVTAVAALLVTAVDITRQGYGQLLQQIEDGKGLMYGPAYEIADYLQAAGADRDSIYMVTDQLVYWLLGSYPPTRLSTHPFNMVQPELVAAIEGPSATPASEMRKILEQRPAFIVKPQTQSYLSEQLAQLLEQALARDYALAAVVADRSIYRRKPH